MKAIEMVTCMVEASKVLSKIEDLFDGFCDVHVYDNKAHIHAYRPKDQGLIMAATKRTLKGERYDEYDVEIEGVHVYWLEWREDNNETV